MSAVSNRVTPASSAALTVSFTVASSILVRNWLVPRPTTETVSPLLPSCRCCMRQGCALRWSLRLASAGPRIPGQDLGDGVARHPVALLGVEVGPAVEGGAGALRPLQQHQRVVGEEVEDEGAD